MEAVIISASAKGHSFIYRTGAIQLVRRLILICRQAEGYRSKDQMASTDSDVARVHM